MSESTHNVVLKLLAAGILVLGLHLFIDGLDAGGVFGKLLLVALGIFVVFVAVGFWKRRGWAFLAVSVGLLAGFFIHLIGFIKTFDHDSHGHGVAALLLVLNIALIGYLGRWSMERRFRPHLDRD